MPVILGSRLRGAATILGVCSALAAGMLVAATPAQAVALSCGTTITHSVILTRNIICPKSLENAITIGAAGVTVNLNGHTIIGPGDTYGTAGILDGGHANVTIESGTISNFYAGVDVVGAGSNSEVTGLTVDNVKVTENTLVNSDYGLFGYFLSGAVVSGLSVSYANIGMELDNSVHCTVNNSKITGASVGFSIQGGYSDTWSYNTVTGVTGDGFDSSRTAAMGINSNTITGDGATGIYDNEGSELSATGNTLSGLLFGIYEEEGLHNRFSGNKESGDAYGLYANRSSHGTFSGNTFSGGEYGIEESAPVVDTLTKNTTNGNSEVGIYIYVGSVTGSSAKLSYNTANDNAFGLYSQIHTKGSGNHAKGNKFVNCFNVSCVKAAR